VRMHPPFWESTQCREIQLSSARFFRWQQAFGTVLFFIFRVELQ